MNAERIGHVEDRRSAGSTAARIFVNGRSEVFGISKTQTGHGQSRRSCRSAGPEVDPAIGAAVFKTRSWPPSGTSWISSGGKDDP